VFEAILGMLANEDPVPQLRALELIFALVKGHQTEFIKAGLIKQLVKIIQVNPSPPREDNHHDEDSIPSPLQPSTLKTSVACATKVLQLLQFSTAELEFDTKANPNPWVFTVISNSPKNSSIDLLDKEVIAAVIGLLTVKMVKIQTAAVEFLNKFEGSLHCGYLFSTFAYRLLFH